MYIANLTYLEPLSEVEKYFEEHVTFLDRYYEVGRFICSGRKNPRIDGVILFHAKGKAEVKQITSEDSFYIDEIVDYEMIGSDPTKCAPSFRCFTE